MTLEHRRRRTLHDLEMAVAAALTVVRRPRVRAQLRAALAQAEALRALERAEELLAAETSGEGGKIITPAEPPADHPAVAAPAPGPNGLTQGVEPASNAVRSGPAAPRGYLSAHLSCPDDDE